MEEDGEGLDRAVVVGWNDRVDVFFFAIDPFACLNSKLL
jgi:hypothetical protein